MTERADSAPNLRRIYRGTRLCRFDLDDVKRFRRSVVGAGNRHFGPSERLRLFLIVELVRHLLCRVEQNVLAADAYAPLRARLCIFALLDHILMSTEQRA